MDDFEHSLFSAPPPRKRNLLLVQSRKIFGQFVFLILVLLSAGVGVLAGLVFVYSVNLPKVRQLQDYHPDVMTELFADDGTVIGSFALEHRVIVEYDQIPEVLRDAVISIEDRHFESHWGVDILGIVRAAVTDILHWRETQGASTLTQQLSRNLFLTNQKSFQRKIQEAILAIQIERQYTKEQIFTMYANQEDLGHGNYGFGAAAEFYFGKPIEQLTLPEAALLAGLLRSPSAYSPILHPSRALARRNVVLAAMLDNGKITPEQYRAAKAAPLDLHIQRWNNNIAPYFVEDVRQFLEAKYGEEAVEVKGLKVYTTLNLHLQELAEQALRQGLHVDDKRRGWRGPEKNILKDPPLLPGGRVATLETYADPDWKKPLGVGSWTHGLVMDVNPRYADVRFGSLVARVTPADFAWTGRPAPAEIFSRGDVDLFLIDGVNPGSLRVTLDQNPTVQGAMLVIDNATGEIKAMVGGYDYAESNFNRAVQAERQVGSSFKVYVYAQALLDGISPFDTIVDEPVSYPTSSGVWSPHNYDDKFEGTITYLHALAESRNVPAVRLLSTVGIDSVIRLCRKFGITSRLVPNLPLALGASDLNLLEHTSAFSTFPDDGVHISPRMVTRVTNYDGRVIDEFQPEITDVLPAPIARLEVSMLREVINSGTAVGARALAAKYPIAGKTGTTNDFTDAWFIGFSPSLTAGVWVGFDDYRPLGPKEEGSRVALPIWMQFMSDALKDEPVEDFPDSPLLTSPAQVQQILASAGGGRFLPGGAKATEDLSTSASATLPAQGLTTIPAPTAPSVKEKSLQPTEKEKPPAAQPGAASSSPQPLPRQDSKAATGPP